jgi:hypothetical protein
MMTLRNYGKLANQVPEIVFALGADRQGKPAITMMTGASSPHNNESSAPQLAHVQQYIHELTGMPEQSDVSGFGFSHLEHFKDDKADRLRSNNCDVAHVDKAEILFGNDWDSTMYHKVCCAVTAYHELTAVKITPSGVYEVLVGSKAGRFRFEEYVDRPYMSLRFRGRQKSRRFRTWWRQRPDPVSVMGRVTAWDQDNQWYQDLTGQLHWRRNYSPPMSIIDWMNLPPQS